jgi:hypothetical protein
MRTKINFGLFGLLFMLTCCTVDHPAHVYDDTTGRPIKGVTIKFNGQNYRTDSLGFVKLRETKYWFGESLHFEEIKKENYRLSGIGRTRGDTIRIRLIQR